MEPIKPQDVYLLADHCEPRDADTWIDPKHWLKKYPGMYVFTDSQMYDIIEDAFEAGRIHALTGEQPDKDEYIESLLNESDV